MRVKCGSHMGQIYNPYLKILLCQYEFDQISHSQGDIQAWIGIAIMR